MINLVINFMDCCNRVRFHVYFKKISTRGLSSLKAISDINFQSGVKRIEEYCRKQNNDQPIYQEIDFYVFFSDLRNSEKINSTIYLVFWSIFCVVPKATYKQYATFGAP